MRVASRPDRHGRGPCPAGGDGEGTGPAGSRFQEAVVAVLCALGRGEVVSYGEVAARAGYPGAARAVGNLLARRGGLPWWRVVRSDGRLAAGDVRRQAELLRAEGIPVRGARIADRARLRRLAPDPAGVPPADLPDS
ncbi:MAG TPA: MGMT family protein [Candidatus Dormibacteraeota bacterium]|nr:MGMT family protein [Candidatus Dormibacteraeota bacterium]